MPSLTTLTGTITLSAGLILATPGAGPPAEPTGASHGGCETDPAAQKHQMRGLWISSVANIDWPSSQDLTAEEAQQELLDHYEMARERGLNSVFVQIRPSADTFWPSAHEPWSHWLTGEQGEDPGWDPTAFAVEEAHARGLDFHAWFNPYRVTQSGTDLEDLAQGHPARENPDWVVSYAGGHYYDPGVPEAREHTMDVISEVVENYDVDGVHFDDYFYPYPVEGEEFDDDASWAAHGEDFTDRGTWRRDNVDALIRDLGERVKSLDPGVSFGVSPFAVWRNSETDPAGSDTTAGAETYDDLYADTRRWVEQEWIDYILPQVYWTIRFETADYARLVPWWHDVVDGTEVDLYIGQATYKVGDSDQSPEWADAGTMSRHLDLNAEYPLVGGDVYFSAEPVRKNLLGHWDILQQEHYSRPALPPVTGEAPLPESPSEVSVAAAESGGNQLSIEGDPYARGHAVYRISGAAGETPDPCALADGTHLVAVLGEGETTWEDPEGESSDTYVVTAVNSQNQEGEPSTPATRP